MFVPQNGISRRKTRFTQNRDLEPGTGLKNVDVTLSLPFSEVANRSKNTYGPPVSRHTSNLGRLTQQVNRFNRRWPVAGFAANKACAMVYRHDRRGRERLSPRAKALP